MKAAGIGGVEIANLYPLALDNPSTGFSNTPFLSQQHLDALRFAAQEARRLGLRVDVTLGSGWPFGGPHIPITEAAGKLRVERRSVKPGETAAQAPFVDAGGGGDLCVPASGLCFRRRHCSRGTDCRARPGRVFLSRRLRSRAP